MPLLVNDTLRIHPILRRYPATQDGWDRFIKVLNEQAVAKLSDVAETFTPTWNGFSTDPVGDLSYINFGGVVLLWAAANLLGTSDATDFTIPASGIPAAIRPSANRVITCSLVDAGTNVPGSAVLGSTGLVQFGLAQVTTSPDIVYSFNAWDAAGSSKGIPAGMTLWYPL